MDSGKGILSGQKALVTGATSGIGESIAIALAEAGADVVINHASFSNPPDETVGKISKFGNRVFSYEANISKEDEVSAMFQKMFDEFGTIDILVNNAGVEDSALFDEMTLDQWNHVINTNLTGPFLCSREAIREFLRRGIVEDVSCSAGKIIYITSVHEEIPKHKHANYAASKGGLKMLMRSVAQGYSRYKIRPNSICPGATKTDLNKKRWIVPSECKKFEDMIPYKRWGTVEDISKAAVWLASDESDYMVGTSMFIDGGLGCLPNFDDGFTH